MPLPQDSNSVDRGKGRRFLVASGTAQYANLSESELPQVPDEIKQVVEALLPFQYARCLADLSHNPRSTDLRDRIPRWFQQDVRDGDLVVLYYSGHGVRDGDSFYLLTHDSEERFFDSTAVSAEQLARWMTKHAHASQVLVILDACYASVGATDFTHIAGKICNLIPQGPVVVVIAAARSKEEAQQGAFSAAFSQALSNVDGQLGGPTQQFLAFDEVMERIDRYLVNHHPSQTATWSSVNARGRLCFFPNPQFKPEVPAGWDLELQAAFREHWVPKAMSSEASGRAWYFTGRTAALRDIVAWLNKPDERICVVTGGAGSGKSAVLARMVILADHKYRASALSPQALESLPDDTIPSEGSIHVAIHARRKLAADLVRAIGEALGLESAATVDAGKLLEAIEQRVDKTVIVIDALDEASEEGVILSQILQPLANLSNVKLLIGTRPDTAEGSPRFRGLGESTREIDLDCERYYDPRDLGSYVERRLLATEELGRKTPYQERRAVVRAVAGAIADRADHVFLVARTAVQWLLAQPGCIDTAKPGWADTLPTGVQEAFQQFLSGFNGQKGWTDEKAKALLRPLAFAEGEGLPWAMIWSQVANALSDQNVTDEDIAFLRNRAAAFIVEGLEEGRSVYRLYHESLAELLRAEAGDGVGVHRCVVEALYQLVPKVIGSNKPDWAKAHRYVLMHLAAHAQAGGMLGTFCQDAAFVVHADPVRLFAVLQRSKDQELQSLREVYLLAVDRLIQSPPEIRAAYLGLVAHQQNKPELAESFAQTNLVGFWSSCWAQGATVTPHHVLAKLPCGVSSLVFTKLEDRPIVIAGAMDGNLHCWDGKSGISRGTPWTGQAGAVIAVAVGTVNGCPVIVSGNEDQTVRCWDLATGQLKGGPLIGHAELVWAVAVGVLGDRAVVVSGSADRTVRCWDLATGQPSGMPLTGHTRAVRAVAVGVLGDCAVVVSGSADRTVRCWNLATGQPKGKPLTGHTGEVLAVAVGTVDGRVVVVSGSADWTVRCWDLATGQPKGKPLTGHTDVVTAVVVGTVDDREVVVSGSRDQTVRCWDLAMGQPSGMPPTGYTDVVTAVAVGTMEGRVVVVSGSADRTVRCWDLATGQPKGKPLTGHTDVVSAVAIGVLGDRAVVVSGSADRTVRCWDLATGQPKGKLLTGHTKGVVTVVVGTVEGRVVVMSGSRDRTVRCWDLATGQSKGKFLTGHTKGVVTVVVGMVKGRAVVLKGSLDHAVRCWDLATGQSKGKPLTGHTDVATAVAVGTVDDRPVVVSGGADRTVRCWDLATGWSKCKPFTGHTDVITAVAVGTVDDRPVVVAGSVDRTVRCWDLATGQPIFVVDLGIAITALSICSNSHAVVGTERGLFVLRLELKRVAILLEH